MIASRNQDHFYGWAWKGGTAKVATSGHEPWQDNAEKGFWIDTLWAEQMLSHETSLQICTASPGERDGAAEAS